MGTITVFQSITIDGVIQAPGRPDEDTRGGFRHGGWADSYQDEVSAAYAAEGMASEGALLFGRRTYEDVLGHWTRVSPNPFVDALLGVQKFVISRTAATTLAYPNSELITGDVVAGVAALKERVIGGLTILGSGELVRALGEADLIDSYALQIHPIVLGTGTRLFEEGGRADLRLMRSIPTTTGVIIAEYTVER